MQVNITEDNTEITLQPRDTWNADVTLALVIVPVLKQLRDDHHGAPNVVNEDVPQALRRGGDQDEWEVDDTWFARWEYVLDEMIWAFQQYANQISLVEDGCDYVRLQNGLDLFAKYYGSLWD